MMWPQKAYRENKQTKSQEFSTGTIDLPLVKIYISFNDVFD